MEWSFNVEVYKQWWLAIVECAATTDVVATDFTMIIVIQILNFFHATEVTVDIECIVNAFELHFHSMIFCAVYVNVNQILLNKINLSLNQCISRLTRILSWHRSILVWLAEQRSEQTLSWFLWINVIIYDLLLLYLRYNLALLYGLFELRVFILEFSENLLKLFGKCRYRFFVFLFHHVESFFLSEIFDLENFNSLLLLFN